jgi:hypothetical protein
VAHALLRTLFEGLEVFRPALTRPGFDTFVILFCGWVLTMGQHAVTQALVATRPRTSASPPSLRRELTWTRVRETIAERSACPARMLSRTSNALRAPAGAEAAPRLIVFTPPTRTSAALGSERSGGIA